MEGIKKPVVEIYTDGACSGNPGVGGYGVVLRFQKDNGDYVIKELSDGFKQTTNNRMEILAAVVGLEALKVPCRVTLTSDSKYVTDAINQNWLENWISKGWKTASKQKVKNVDLWERLLAASEKHDINWVWVKGHNGHEFNEICDKLAVEAYNGENLKIDAGYEA